MSTASYGIKAWLRHFARIIFRNRLPVDPNIAGSAVGDFQTGELIVLKTAMACKLIDDGIAHLLN